MNKSQTTSNVEILSLSASGGEGRGELAPSSLTAKDYPFLRLFIYSAGALLLGAALIRFIIATGDAQALSLPEPLLGIPLRHAVLLVGAIQLGVALICLFGRQHGFQIFWLVWLSSAFITYQAGMRWQHVGLQGTGLGSLTDPLHLARGLTGYLITVLPCYLVLGTCASGFWLAFSPTTRTARRKAAKQLIEKHDTAAGMLKMSCPKCRGHIKFQTQNLGRNQLCPHCQKTITLSKPDFLKMPCFFCQGHIEFPAYSIGEKLNCPHCKKDITLKDPG